MRGSATSATAGPTASATASIEQLSYDHSLVWEYARLKHIDPDEVQDIPSNVIHRCLGPEPLVQVDIEGPHPLRSGDIFLLCSDGLSGQVTDHEIGAVASVLPPAEACRFLIDLANLRGGPDNITVVIVRVGGSGADANGVAPTARGKRRGIWRACPVVADRLVGGHVAGGRGHHSGVRALDRPGGATFVFAIAAIVAGLAGLALHYRREQPAPRVEEEEPPRRASIVRRPARSSRPCSNA